MIIVAAPTATFIDALRKLIAPGETLIETPM